MLKLNEIFYSIQGEGTRAGLPCVFVRLTYCNLRCTYCDTEYSFYEGTDWEISQVIDKVRDYNCNLVEITGGEPLIQAEVHPLMTQLCDLGYTVMIETGGSLDISPIDPRVTIIMDLKTPSSKMAKKNRYENIPLLKSTDEVKFVIGSREDYEWSKEQLEIYNLPNRCNVLFSPVFGKIEPIEIAQWILHDNLSVRFQLQLHKFIWEPDTKGV